MFGPHTAFIVGAYAFAAAIVALLVGWIVADARAQKRALAALERSGVTRRSAGIEARREP